jgi:PEP-CTERM motif-containing protein
MPPVKRLPLSTLGSRVALASLMTLTLAARATAAPIADVRTLYLIPSDAVYNPQYEQAIVSALGNLQSWYAGELGGSTFALHDPIVEVFSTPHPAAYYATNPNGSFDQWFFFNVVADAFALSGAQFNDPAHAWVFYIDAEPAAGQIGGGGTSGVAVLPQHDLRGLIGAEPAPVSRWIGGLGHELGHAFGLSHPASCPGPTCPDQTLMWLGYISYPNTFFLPEDKQALLASPFIAPVEGTAPVPEPGTLALIASGLAGLVMRRLRGRSTH